MATIKKGILGGFSGKVGTVIGSNWKSISTMRSIPEKVKNPKTSKQTAHRAKFKLIMDYLKPMAPFLKIGFRHYTKKQTPLNAALSYNIEKAVYGMPPNYWINTSTLLVTRGALTPINHAYAYQSGPSMLINWGDNSGTGDANPNDYALAIMYNTTNGEIRTFTNGPQRSEKSGGFTIPQNWTGCWVDVYLGFISNDRKKVSNSKYINGMLIQ